MSNGKPKYVLPFEKPVVDLEAKIAELQELSSDGGVDLSSQIDDLKAKADALRQSIFHDLGPWERTLISRHPERPYFLDYVETLFSEWVELHGDRNFMDDRAIVGGLARFHGRPVVLIGQQKGRTTKEKVARNFGMPRPEGYRKALRLMSLAERFNRPIITFVDTPGAYPGIGAEERGQAEAIAKNILVMAKLKVPIITLIAGEGGSGGALAIAVANRVLMLENAIYSVISPEACASILWRDGTRGEEAARALRYTANDCLGLEVTDEVVDEPDGGAHRDPAATIEAVGRTLKRHLDELLELDGPALVDDRYARFRKLGRLDEAVQP